MEILGSVFGRKKGKKMKKVTAKVEEEALSVLKDNEMDDNIDIDDDSKFSKVDEYRDEDKDRDEEDDRYRKLKNFEGSLLNMIINDRVLRYALENGKWEFLQEIKNGQNDGYKAMEKEMKENGGGKFEFEGSVLQKISETYVYFVALEKFNTKVLNRLVNKTALYNDWWDYAKENGIPVDTGGMIFRDYMNWIESKKLK